MAGLALTFLITFGLVGFVLRMLVQLRRTGSTGFRGISGKPGSAEWLGGVLLVLGIALAVVGAVLDLAEVLSPLVDSEVVRAAGVGLALGGIVTTSYAQLAMGDEWRIGVDPDEETGLVTGGPFTRVRNPIYTGMINFFLGIALMVLNPVTVAGAVVVLVSLEMQTRLVEEPHMLRVHGRSYADYAQRAGRFLPGIGRLRKPGV